MARHKRRSHRHRGGFSRGQDHVMTDVQEQQGQPDQYSRRGRGGDRPYDRQQQDQRYHGRQNRRFNKNQQQNQQQNQQFDTGYNHPSRRNQQFEQQQNNHPRWDSRQKKIQCDRCEKNGHMESSCTSREVPVDQRCPCGNTFHYLNQCIYGGDRTRRDGEKPRNDGMLCTWCKDTGDGRHTFDGCSKAEDFKLDLRRIQYEAADGLDFCWHCSRVDHRTRVCTGAQAKLDTPVWEAQITNVVEDWKSYSYSARRAAYLDNERDFPMRGVRDVRFPPLAKEYQWCVYCEKFGHATGENPEGCKMLRYEYKCPPEYRSRPVVSKGVQSQRARADNRLIPHNFHPQQPPQLSQSGIIEMGYLLREFGAGFASGNQSSVAKTPARSRSAVRREELCQKRPSLKMSKALALGRELGAFNAWDAHTHRYTDGTRQDLSSPVLWDDGRYFNEDWMGGGNYQEYFPAITFTITGKMQWESEDETAPINQVAVFGRRAKCEGCQAPILVYDEEDDLVMCNTGSTNTLGEGRGNGHYIRRDGTKHPKERDCLWFIGQKGRVGWEDARTGHPVAVTIT